MVSIKNNKNVFVKKFEKDFKKPFCLILRRDIRKKCDVKRDVKCRKLKQSQGCSVALEVPQQHKKYLTTIIKTYKSQKQYYVEKNFVLIDNLTGYIIFQVENKQLLIPKLIVCLFILFQVIDCLRFMRLN